MWSPRRKCDRPGILPSRLKLKRRSMVYTGEWHRTRCTYWEQTLRSWWTTIHCSLSTTRKKGPHRQGWIGIRLSWPSTILRSAMFRDWRTLVTMGQEILGRVVEVGRMRTTRNTTWIGWWRTIFRGQLPERCWGGKRLQIRNYSYWWKILTEGSAGRPCISTARSSRRWQWWMALW